MKMIALILILFLLSGCDTGLPTVPIPVNKGTSLLENADAVPETVKAKMEGIYSVVQGSSDFGEEVVLKWNEDRLSVFTEKEASYLILHSGIKDSAVVFEGYWRAAVSSKTGLVTLSLLPEACADSLLRGLQPSVLKISGHYGFDSNKPNMNLTLQFERPLPSGSKDFWIIAHRGGGRTADRLPHSENSVGMIEYAENLGANAVELDVQITSDKIPVLFHDKYMNKRLVNEDYFIGAISDYSFAQLRTFCTLIQGERIPSLDEALRAVVENTSLKLVWLDVKEAAVLKEILPLQEKYLALAKDLGRDLEILIGIPNDDVLHGFLSLEDYANIPSLCELGIPDVQETASLVWAPRWSLGFLKKETDEIHALGKRAFVWTLDDKVLIKSFIKNADFDGIITNYPALVAYEFYIQK